MLIEHHMTRVVSNRQQSSLITSCSSGNSVNRFMRPNSNFFPTEETVTAGPGQVTENLRIGYESTKRGRHHQNFSVRIISLDMLRVVTPIKACKEGRLRKTSSNSRISCIFILNTINVY